ncbi:MAG: 30S ribosomal protein S17 [Candidatus Pacearchaeota archaeon]|jgi:ribosomal protein S17
MEKKTRKQEEKVGKVLAGAKENIVDTNCPTRGRKFEGYVIKKFENRVVIRFEKVKYIKKYERYVKTQSKMHARLPSEIKDQINMGDYIQIMECRPLSKILHFIVIKKIRNAEQSLDLDEEVRAA